MTLKQTFALIQFVSLSAILFIVIVTSVMFATYSDIFLITNFGADPLASARILIMVSAGTLLVSSIVVSLIALRFIKKIIVTPFQNVIIAMAAFTEEGVREEVIISPSAPTEVQTLSGIFKSLSGRVEETHAKDMEVSRVKSDFISTAAHQLRTPLTGIRWALEALQKQDLTQEQQMFLKSAVDKSHDLVAVVGTLLDISSIESGKYKYNFKECDLQRLASEVTNDFMPPAKDAKVSLTYSISDSEGHLPNVKADRDRIKWILNNLIENAIRYTPAGGSVQVAVSSIPGRILVQVRDTGIGIPQENRNNIFERFYRAGNAIAKENKGSGLGLYIARTIANDHGGDLNFSPNTGGPGTTFSLSLPTQ